MNVEALREDAAWTQGKQPRMAVRPSWVLVLCDAADALEKVTTVQPDALKMIESNGFVFTDIGNEPGNWQHLAFTLYTVICELDSQARAAIRLVEEA